MMLNSNPPVYWQEETQALLTLTVADGLILSASVSMAVGGIAPAQVAPAAEAAAVVVNTRKIGDKKILGSHLILDINAR